MAFVGTGLAGWQAQARGTTVQGLVDEALKAIGHRGARVVGCSRTDAGVHARLFTAHVDASMDRPLEAVLKGLNANLPPQVRIYRVHRVPGDFHARHSCSGKSYRYHLFTAGVVPPHLAPYVWAWQGPLDGAAMERAARAFVGEHDFSALTTREGRERNTRRSVTQCGWERRGSLLVLHVAGPSFLHRMVRCMGGAMVAAGTGRLVVEEIQRALAGDLSGPQIPALPAQGLALWEVRFEGAPAPTETAGTLPDTPLFPLEA